MAILLPQEDGVNIIYPATQLGRKIVSEGREEGPNKGGSLQGEKASTLQHLTLKTRNPLPSC